MPWIKRNMGLVIGLAVGVLLLGLAGWFLMGKKAAADAASLELDEATQKLTTLYNRDPRPNQQNITAGREDAKHLESFIGDVEKYFAPPAIPQGITGRTFGLLLDERLNDLRQSAKRFSVKLPQDYKFSFASMSTNVNIPTEVIPSLVTYLSDVEAITRALFISKVNALDSLKRPSVPQDETLGSSDFLTEKPTTNEWVTSTPYEVSFRGFSPNLADVLKALRGLDRFVTVKDIVVGVASGEDPSAQPGGYPMSGLRTPDSMPAGGMPPELASRYGLGQRSRYGMRPMQPVVPVTPVTRGPGTVVDEQLLLVTMKLEVARAIHVPKTDAASPAGMAGTEPATF